MAEECVAAYLLDTPVKPSDVINGDSGQVLSPATPFREENRAGCAIG